MSSVIDSIERAQLRRVPAFQAGDRVRVHFQVVEGDRKRTQVFEGAVIKRQGTGARETFTVRKQSFGVGVERTFPLHSPKVEQIEVAARGDVRRAKLYYLRDRVGRAARVRERRFTGTPEETLYEGPPEEGTMPPPETDVPAGAADETADETDVDQREQTVDEVEAPASQDADDADATEPAESGQTAADETPATEASSDEQADSEQTDEDAGEERDA